MEEHWLHWVIFWAVIPTTLVFFWMLFNYLEKTSNKITSKKMIPSMFIKKHSKVISKPTSSHQKFIIAPKHNDILERISLMEHGSNVKDKVSSSLLSEEKIHPPDIYVINEKGKPVQYIMCV